MQLSNKKFDNYIYILLTSVCYPTKHNIVMCTYFKISNKLYKWRRKHEKNYKFYSERKICSSSTIYIISSF